jgi:hypothetical protein
MEVAAIKWVHVSVGKAGPEKLKFEDKQAPKEGRAKGTACSETPG